MSLIKVVPYVIGMTPGVPGAPEPRMYPRSGYFLVTYVSVATLAWVPWVPGNPSVFEQWVPEPISFET